MPPHRPSSGQILRDLKASQQAMKKARRVMADLREFDPPPTELVQSALQSGWESLARTHRVLAEISGPSSDDEVVSRMIAAQRYATSLLVRLRRLARDPQRPGPLDDDDRDDPILENDE